MQPGDLKWAVTADPQLLASAVTNLLNNAFKYTAPGGRVVLRATTNDEAHLLIDIEDECGGIPESEATPFSRSASGAVATGAGGTGAQTSLRQPPVFETGSVEGLIVVGDRLSHSRVVCTNGQRFTRAPDKTDWMHEFSLVEGVIYER